MNRSIQFQCKRLHLAKKIVFPEVEFELPKVLIKVLFWALLKVLLLGKVLFKVLKKVLKKV